MCFFELKSVDLFLVSHALILDNISVESWLFSVNMGKYAREFLSENIDGKMLITLDEDILEEIGVKKFHCKKLAPSTYIFFKSQKNKLKCE